MFVVITYIISFILNLVPFVGYIVSVVVSVPFSYGLIISMMKLNDDTEVGCVDFFKHGFSNFGKSWSVTLWIMLKLILPFLCMVIGIIILGQSIFYASLSAINGGSSASPLLTMVAYVLLFGGSIWGIIKQLTYRLSFYILTDHPEMTGKEAVNKSAELMNGKVWSLFCLNLSFIGWAILAVFTFGIGMLWLTPYIQISEINFYRNLVGSENSQENSTEEA